MPTTPTLSSMEKLRSVFERTRTALKKRSTLGKGTATTRATIRDGLTCEVEDGRWSFVADLSEKAGGGGEGPDPGVLGRAALGSCLAVGYVIWASYRGVPLSSVQVEVEADYDVRPQYGVGESSPAYQAIRCVVHVESPAPEEDVRAVLEEAEAHSPYLALFRDPQEVSREVRFTPGGD